MTNSVEKITSSENIQKQLKEFNSKILSNLPSLDWENFFGDFARSISFTLWLDRNFNPSWYVEALAKAREINKSANNKNYNSSQEKSA